MKLKDCIKLGIGMAIGSMITKICWNAAIKMLNDGTKETKKEEKEN